MQVAGATVLRPKFSNVVCELELCLRCSRTCCCSGSRPAAAALLLLHSAVKISAVKSKNVLKQREREQQNSVQHVVCSCAVVIKFSVVNCALCDKVVL